MAKVAPEPNTGCWLWTGAIDQGYGKTSLRGRTLPAHRLSYLMHVGIFPYELQLDHLCRTRACVNPAHLEPVSPKENVLRGTGHCAVNARKTHCRKGHAFSPENTYLSPRGYRSCFSCKREYGRERRARARSERLSIGSVPLPADSPLKEET